jgi:hypothetical protein
VNGQGALFAFESDDRKPWQRARAGRDEALQRVDDHADPDWKDVALEAVYATARARPEFISDDVWLVGELPRTREDRALGPVFLRAVRNGWIVKTDRVRPSVRSHLSGKPIWVSRIHEEA